MDYPLSDILDAAREQGHSDDFIRNIEVYAERLLNDNLPVIFSLPHLAISMNLEVRDIKQMVSGHRRIYYKRFKLKKRSGGFRTIQSPESQLKYVQRWILTQILNQIPSHEACQGFDLVLPYSKMRLCTYIKKR